MDPTLQAALAAPAPWIFGAVEIVLPGYNLRLLDGAGQIAINGNLYQGEDATFGTLASISTLSEDMGDEAPEISIELYPPNASAMATLCNPNMQGSRVTIMVGVVDPASGLIIGQPEVKFLGEIDVPSLTIGENGQRSLSYTAVSVFERLFETDEGARAQDAWHQSIWPGEKGLEFMTGTDKNLYWGAKRPKGQQTQKTQRSSAQYPFGTRVAS